MKIHLIAGLRKKRYIIQKWISSKTGASVKVELDLSNYAKKAYLKMQQELTHKRLLNSLI